MLVFVDFYPSIVFFILRRPGCHVPPGFVVRLSRPLAISYAQGVFQTGMARNGKNFYNFSPKKSNKSIKAGCSTSTGF